MIPKERLIPATILLICTYLPFILYFLFNIHTGFFVLLALILFLSLYEFYSIFRMPFLYIIIKTSVLMVLFLFVYGILSSFKYIPQITIYQIVMIALVSSVIYYLVYLPYNLRKNWKRILNFFFIYSGSLIYIFIPLILNLVLTFSYTGLNMFLYQIIVCKVSDTGALIIGKRYGQLKLAGKISPNKTVEGLFGSIFFGLTLSLIFYLVSPILWKVNIIVHLFVSLLIILLNSAGDLFESFLKRLNNVKDSSKILAGIGGILDLIDGALFTTPCVYLYCNYIRS